MATYFEHSRWKNYCTSFFGVNGRNRITQMEVISCRLYSFELEIVTGKREDINRLRGNGSTLTADKGTNMNSLRKQLDTNGNVKKLKHIHIECG